MESGSFTRIEIRK